MSTKTSSSQKEEYENQFSDFLINRITKAGGSLQLQPITGHYSQLKPEVRSAIGSSVSDLKQFLLEHKNLFSLHNNIVSLVNSSAMNQSGYDSDNSSTGVQTTLPAKIQKGRGVVVKLFVEFGFIKCKEPVKTNVYFTASIFGSSAVDLTSLLYIGAVVYFNARKETHEGKSKYKATKVWRADESNPEDSNIILKSRKNRNSGLYDPLTLDNEGIIQKVFPNLGFIAVKGDEKNTVFFYKDRLANFANVLDLTKVLSSGDPVEFNAHRSTKPNSRARWEAIKVWKKSDKGKQNVCKSDDGSSRSSLPKHPDVKPVNPPKDEKKSQKGKICPRSNGAVIKFGDNELADGDSALYFICGTQVTEISWEFSEGDDVSFDAVKIKSAPGWRATLVWTGKKPDVDLPKQEECNSELTDEENEASSSFYTSKSSSCMSLNSNSSLKSMSIKSAESIGSRKEENLTEKNSKLSKTVMRESGDNIKKLKSSKFEHSQHSNELFKSSLHSSNNYLKAMKESKNDKSSDDVTTKSVSSWADITYPDDDDSENNPVNLETSNSAARDSECEKTNHNNANENPDKKSKSYLKKTNCKSKCDKTNGYYNDNNPVNLEAFNKMAHDSECEETIHNSANEDLGKKSISKLKKTNTEIKCDKTVGNEFADTSKPKIDKDASELKNIAKIRSFRNVKGEIIKVYSKFAEVKNSNSQGTVSFFWNDFYSNGVSVKELELDDLKQILKVGDIIHLNYFIVVDDLEQMWQRVSLAWQGSKPRMAFEMSPAEFIKQNSLTVTINKEVDTDQGSENKGTSGESTTAAFEGASCQSDEDFPTESYPVNSEPLISDEISIVNESGGTHLSMNAADVQSTVCEILKKAISSSGSMVDIHSVAEDIIDIVLAEFSRSYDSCNVLQTDENRIQRISDTCTGGEKTCINMPSQQDIILKDCEVQTIITGDIIAHNIFTEC